MSEHLGIGGGHFHIPSADSVQRVVDILHARIGALESLTRNRLDLIARLGDPKLHERIEALEKLHLIRMQDEATKPLPLPCCSCFCSNCGAKKEKP